MKINIIEAPTGVLVAVGFQLPLDLSYRNLDGDNLTTQQGAELHHAGPGFCSRFAKRVTWLDIQAATVDVLERYPQAEIAYSPKGD